MTRGEEIRLSCTITSGGFSGERVVRIERVDGKVHAAAAPAAYCFDKNAKSLKADQPGPGEKVEGFVAARFVSAESDDTVWVHLPSGEVIPVKPAVISGASMAEA